MKEESKYTIDLAAERYEVFLRTYVNISNRFCQLYFGISCCGSKVKVVKVQNKITFLYN